MDDFDWPKPNIDELPDMYAEIDDMLIRVEGALREHLPVEDRGEVDVVVFVEASADDILDAMWEEPNAVVPMFQKISGLPNREYRALYNEPSIGNRLRDYTTDFRDRENAVQFAAAMKKHLPDELYVETVLYTFAKMWENDQRRFARMSWEDDVIEFLNNNGYPAKKDESLPGQPDVAVPKESPYEVVGEVRVMKPEDIKKRIKNFRDEAREAAQNFPDCKFVIFANLPPYALEGQREERRLEIGDRPEIDAVFFRDELEDRVLDQLQEWGVTRQTSLSD